MRQITDRPGRKCGAPDSRAVVGMSDSRLVTVVIPTCERRASLERLLTALDHQTLPPEQFEVVAVLNGADDGTAAMIEQLRTVYRLRWVRHPRQNRASARNHGVRVAHGRLIVFLDDDMEPAAEFLRAHVDAHATGDRRGIVGAAPIPFDASSPPVVVFRALRFQRKLQEMAARASDLRFNQVYSGNLSLPRALFLEVGGFDEEFTLYGYEDYELVVRLLKRGVRFSFSEQALARQHYTKDFAALARDVIAEGRNAILFARKHPEFIGELQLARYTRRGRRDRHLRTLMLVASRAWSGFPSVVIRGFQRVEARRPARLMTLYRFVFDYLYWYGVDTALGGSSRSRRAPVRLSKRLQQLPDGPSPPPSRSPVSS